MAPFTVTGSGKRCVGNWLAGTLDVGRPLALRFGKADDEVLSGVDVRVEDGRVPLAVTTGVTATSAAVVFLAGARPLR